MPRTKKVDAAPVDKEEAEGSPAEMESEAATEAPAKGKRGRKPGVTAAKNVEPSRERIPRGAKSAAEKKLSEEDIPVEKKKSSGKGKGRGRPPKKAEKPAPSSSEASASEEEEQEQEEEKPKAAKKTVILLFFYIFYL